MSSHAPTATSHSPAPWGPYAALTVLLAALPADQLQHWATAASLALTLGEQLRRILPNEPEK